MFDLVANKPIDVPTRETVLFLASHIPAGAQILEIGCGEGLVASELFRHGYRVTGLDSDPALIEKAQNRGISAIVALWPTFDATASFDAIAFTRSLHHIRPLREAVDHARELLKPIGSLLIEDFAYEEADEATIRWFVKLLHSRQAMSLIDPAADQLVTELLSSTDLMGAWHHNQGHDVHSSTTMSKAIAECFVVREVRSVAYLYRYLIPVLAESLEAAAFVSQALQEETFLGQSRQLILLGRRIVAAPKPY
jgi:2-polyprenyl-3-methyl-5-hydroxy-6-metoxy-1,4-benzoquinol methylase